MSGAGTRLGPARAAIALFLLLTVLVHGHDVRAGAVTITVGAEPRQTFAGLGTSFEQTTPYGELSSEHQATVDRLLFQELDMRIVRLWYGPGEPEAIRDIYLANGLIETALENGVEELLLGPWDYDGDPVAHGRQIADDVRVLRDEYGIPITATGLINEPSSKDFKILPPKDFVPMQVAVRQALEELGHDDVTVLAPEWASANEAATEWFDIIEASPEAMASFDAFATHSYNMAASPDFAERTLRHGKDYWMTEAGGPKEHGSAEFNYAVAATASARFLNDLNHGVTHWIWFLGLGQGGRDVNQKLVMCEQRCAYTDRIYKNYTYHHIQQVTESFPAGTVLRQVTSDLKSFPNLHYTYGPKPPVNAAAGVRPDGRFVFGVVNDTRGGEYRMTSWPDPETYTVTLQVPEFLGAPGLDLILCRTNVRVQVACGETVSLEGGEITLEVASLELITLISMDPLG